MKKIITLVLATIMLSSTALAAGPAKLCHSYPGYAMEGPNHTDFLRVADWKESLRRSLYNISTDHYEGPETLAIRKIRYEYCMRLFNLS